MARDEHDDETLVAVESDLDGIQPPIEKLEFRRMFSNPMDPNSCFVDVNRRTGPQCSSACTFDIVSARTFQSK